MTDLRLLIALPLAIAAGFIGWAVAETWTAVHTGFALAGVLMVLGIAAHGLGSAAGVALHDRRADRGHAAVYPTTGRVADPLTVHRALELEAKTAASRRQAELDGWQGGTYQVHSYQDRLTAEREEAEPWG